MEGIYILSSLPVGERARERGLSEDWVADNLVGTLAYPTLRTDYQKVRGTEGKRAGYNGCSSEIPKYKGKSGILQMTNPMNFCLLFV